MFYLILSHVYVTYLNDHAKNMYINILSSLFQNKNRSSTNKYIHNKNWFKCHKSQITNILQALSAILSHMAESDSRKFVICKKVGA